MTENANTAVAEQEETFVYPVSVADEGPATKKVTVEIPKDRIASKLTEQFKELRQQAAIPGFRIGHAPQKLIEKKFASDVRDQVKRTLISESYEQAVENNKLQVVGEPEFQDADKITLPDDGDLQYSFTVEVQPEFTVPDLTQLKIKKPKIAINEDHVKQALQNLREQQGELKPVEGRGVKEKDFLTADVHVKLGDEILHHQHGTQIVARAGRLGGIQIDDLATKLEGAKVGEKKSFNVTASDTHAEEKARGKELTFDIDVKEIKELHLAEINKDFLDSLGFEKEEELHDALREQMEERVKADVQNSMREQVSNALLEQIPLNLPAKLSAAQEARVVQRRAVDLLQRGVAEDAIRANLEMLKGGAKEEAVRELKLFFILQKIAEDAGVDISEGELNGNIAAIAAQQGKRPEKLKSQMSSDGSLQNLYVRLREQKAIDSIVDKAIVEEVEPDQAAKPEATKAEIAASAST